MIKNLRFKCLKENWSIVLAILFCAIALVYCIVVKDRIYLEVHDFLDGQATYYKILKDYGLFWSLGKKAPILGGIDRDYLFSDLKVYSWLYMIFPNLAAIIIGWFLKIIISIFSFIFLGKTIYTNERDKNIFIMIGLIYGVLPTYPTSAFGFASLPLILAMLIKLYHENNWKYYLFIFLYPLLSEFSFFGMFICGYIVVFFLIDWIVKKKPAVRMLVALFAISLGYIITEWRLFYIILFSKEETIRSTFIVHYLDWSNAFDEFYKVFVYGHYHSGSLHTYIILPICLIYLLCINAKYILAMNKKKILTDPYNWIMMWQIINCGFYVFDQMEWFSIFLTKVLPILKGFSFARMLWFSPFLWYFSFMIILTRLRLRRVLKTLICTMALVLVCIIPTKYNHIHKNIINLYILEADALDNAEYLTYGEFYSSGLFDQIKEDINYDGEWSVAYGMHPSVLIYNDISTLDGYISYYSKDYKSAFRKLIEPDFVYDKYNENYYDEWGARAYIFSKDIDYQPYRQMKTNEGKLLINMDVFKEMGGKYIFSRVKITNAEELDIVELGAYTDEKSPYTIWVYLYQ